MRCGLLFIERLKGFKNCNWIIFHQDDTLIFWVEITGFHAMEKSSYKKVLWITADEFRPDCIGAAGNTLIQTPNLDLLAREGVLFKNAFCQGSPCAPSRSCMHTGRYLCSTGVLDNLTPLADAHDSLPALVSEHGCKAAIAGYNDYARDPAILPEGHPHRNALSYDHFLPGYEVVLKHDYDSPEWYQWLQEKGYAADDCNRETMYSHQIPTEGRGGHLPLYFPAHYKAEHSEARFVTEKAIRYLQSQEKNDWLFSLNYIKPHGPYICPDPYHALYSPEDMTEPLRRPQELENDHPYISRCRNDWAQTELKIESEWRELRACYYGMITELDHCIGLLFDYLKQSGQWEETLIIFTADHGTYLGDHYLAGKPHFYDAAIHVPMIIRDPDSAADPLRGHAAEGFIESVDIAPTICDFLGVPPHPRFQGKSVLPYLRGHEGASLKNEIFYEFYYYNLLRDTEGVCPEECRLWVVRDKAYKYVQFGEIAMPAQLFDLKKYPSEFDNVAALPSYAPVVAAYCQQLIRWRIRNEDCRQEQWARRYR
jgi:arylsulfatase A-like enzyme